MHICTARIQGIPSAVGLTRHHISCMASSATSLACVCVGAVVSPIRHSRVRSAQRRSGCTVDAPPLPALDCFPTWIRYSARRQRVLVKSHIRRRPSFAFTAPHSLSTRDSEGSTTFLGVWSCEVRLKLAEHVWGSVCALWACAELKCDARGSRDAGYAWRMRRGTHVQSIRSLRCVS